MATVCRPLIPPQINHISRYVLEPTQPPSDESEATSHFLPPIIYFILTWKVEGELDLFGLDGTSEQEAKLGCKLSGVAIPPDAAAAAPSQTIIGFSAESRRWFSVTQFQLRDSIRLDSTGFGRFP